MSIFQKIFRPGKSEETPQDIAALIGELDAQEAEARRRLAEIEARRSALLISGDDAKLDADILAKDRLARVLERVKLARPDLETRLKAAQDRYRQRLIDELAEERRLLVAELDEALMKAVDANERVIEFQVRQRALLGDRLVMGVSEQANFLLLTREVVETWRTYIQEMKGQIKRPATFPQKVLSAVPSAKKVPKATPYVDSLQLRKPSEQLPQAGNLRIQLLRAGIELPGGGVSRIGDIVDLPNERAMALLRNGAAEGVPTPEAELVTAAPDAPDQRQAGPEPDPLPQEAK